MAGISSSPDQVPGSCHPCADRSRPRSGRRQSQIGKVRAVVASVAREQAISVHARMAADQEVAEDMLPRCQAVATRRAHHGLTLAAARALDVAITTTQVLVP